MSGRRRQSPAQLQAGLVVTGFHVRAPNAAFAGTPVGAMLAKAVHVVIEAVIDHTAADAVLSWNVGHPVITSDIGKPSSSAISAHEASAKEELVRAERDGLTRELAEQRRQNEHLRRIIGLMKPRQLAQRSTAFPKPNTRFSWLEVD